MPFFQGVSYDATFESMDVPEEMLELRDQRMRERGGKRVDDVEFTFEKGRWGHLGEATLWNRIKSHQDVGEVWYPDILKRIREEQAVAKAKAEETAGSVVERGEEQTQGTRLKEGVQAVKAH